MLYPVLTYYRCLERNREQTSFLDGMKPHQPSLFVGAADLANELSATENHLPKLRKKVLLDGVRHHVPKKSRNSL